MDSKGLLRAIPPVSARESNPEEAPTSRSAAVGGLASEYARAFRATAMAEADHRKPARIRQLYVDEAPAADLAAPVKTS
ncbi:MAG: hypothetical protein ABI624_17650 [Casimicrobiaceae bacterium]